MQTLLQQTQVALQAYCPVNPRGRYRDDNLKQQAVACFDKKTFEGKRTELHNYSSGNHMCECILCYKSEMCNTVGVIKLE